LDVHIPRGDKATEVTQFLSLRYKLNRNETFPVWDQSEIPNLWLLLGGLL